MKRIVLTIASAAVAVLTLAAGVVSCEDYADPAD